MATHESPQDPIKYKKLVLKVSIDCDGCRKRVNKILSKVPGVQEIDINIKQQKVTVTGDVDAFVLLKKLRKSGRQVELLPEMKTETVTLKRPEKTKDKEKQPPQLDNDDKVAGKLPQVQVKAPPPQEQVINSKTTAGDSAAESSTKSVGKNDGVSSASEVMEDSPKESEKSEPEKESKSETNNPENRADNGDPHPPPTAAEKKDIDSDNSTTGKVESTNVGKKKKKGGHNGNKAHGLSSSINDAATDQGPPVPPKYSLPTNHVLPRGHDYYGYPHDLYTSAPVYAASYNTSHASTSTTTSYYAQPPADSYVYAYSGPMPRQPTPSDLEEYSRQPLDSLEMFSDENPNGCSIM